LAKRRVGETLKRLREARAFTQEELADRAGLHRVYVTQLEIGVKTNPRLDTLERLAKVLRVTVAELLGEEGR
jgi:transcriptional regulator with XRE-family HTH domain